jgi:hypothetical protein
MKKSIATTQPKASPSSSSTSKTVTSASTKSIKGSKAGTTTNAIPISVSGKTSPPAAKSVSSPTMITLTVPSIPEKKKRGRPKKTTTVTLTTRDLVDDDNVDDDNNNDVVETKAVWGEESKSDEVKSGRFQRHEKEAIIHAFNQQVARLQLDDNGISPPLSLSICLMLHI